MEWEASFAIDFAIAAIEEAKSAVLDVVSRLKMLSAGVRIALIKEAQPTLGTFGRHQ
jgi:hypothetical protein